jgi:Homeodomain-like domain
MAMRKKYIVRLTGEDREQLGMVIRALSGSSSKVRRAQVLLKADADGPHWTDRRIADAFNCRTRTIEELRERFVTQGFAAALDKKQPETPPRAKVLDGCQEAKVIAMRLGRPPAGYSNWSLRLLAGRVVELGIVESVSRETLRRALKKTASRRGRFNTG